MNWEQSHRQFVADKQASGRSDATVRYYLECWREFGKFWDGKQVIDRFLLREYLVHLQERVKVSTTATRWRGLKVFLRWCFDEGLIESDPTQKVRTPKQLQEKKESLTEAQLARLYSVAQHSRDRALLALMIDTGLRSREIRELRASDVDTFSRAVTIKRGKNGKSRTVPLSPESARVLRRWMNSRDEAIPVLFYAIKGRQEGSPLAQGGLNRIVKRLGKKAGVKVYAHLVRHSFARSFVVQGGNVATLQALLGHSSLEVTNRYVALNFADLAEHHGLHSPFRAVQEAAKNRKC